MEIRPFREVDEAAVIALWERCGLTRHWNDPRKDVRRKLQVQRELFLVGVLDGQLVASVMAGYDGHRGWINYLAVSPDHQRRGLGRAIMAEAERRLRHLGCPKINLQVRTTNTAVIEFYRAIGFSVDEVVGLGKRLVEDRPPPDDKGHEVPAAILDQMIDYYRQRAGEYDQWWDRQGRYDRSPETTRLWLEERQRVYNAFDSIPFHGHVLELAPGTGTWTRRLAQKADALTAIDASPEMIQINRAKVASDKVRYVVADLFQWRHDRPYDGIVFGFWISHMPIERLAGFLQMVAQSLRPGGLLFFVDGLREPTSTAADHDLPPEQTQLMTRKLNDGRSFQIVKNFHSPELLTQLCHRAGLTVRIDRTPTYFYYATGERTR